MSKKDLVIEWYSGGPGTGGQYRNRHQNCFRMKHPESGVQVQATDSREQKSNIREAFIRLTKHADFKLWLARRLREIRTGETVESRVNNQMHPRNMIVEVLEGGQWVRETV